MKAPVRNVVVSCFICVSVFVLNIMPLHAQQAKADVLNVANRFFLALEQRDTASFSALFVPGAVNYYVQQKEDSITIGTQVPFGVVFNKNRTIKERFRPAGMDVQVSNNVAMVWGRYDLWINEKFSHCGTDVFTLMKTSGGWKIASLSFSIEKDGCEQ